MRARRTYSDETAWEQAHGYSRAVAIGDSCWVAGTTGRGPDGAGDVAEQTRVAFQRIERALASVGFALPDVVRTRMYVTRPGDATTVASIHGEVLGAIRPVATLVVVSALIEPDLLVEIEAEARRAAAG